MENTRMPSKRALAVLDEPPSTEPINKAADGRVLRITEKVRRAIGLMVPLSAAYAAGVPAVEGLLAAGGESIGAPDAAGCGDAVFSCSVSSRETMACRTDKSNAPLANESCPS
jgi:hypothetical protein